VISSAISGRIRPTREPVRSRPGLAVCREREHEGLRLASAAGLYPFGERLRIGDAHAPRIRNFRTKAMCLLSAISRWDWARRARLPYQQQYLSAVVDIPSLISSRFMFFLVSFPAGIIAVPRWPATSFIALLFAAGCS